MDLGSIFLILALLMLTGWFIGRPFFERRQEALTPEQSAQERVNHERSALLAERDRLMNALTDLDFDNTLGKIPPEDYPTQRRRLMTLGAEVLRRLDAFEPAADAVGETAAAVEDRLEIAIAARRADGAAHAGGNSRKRPISSSPDDELEAALAARRRQRLEKSAGFCHRCGVPIQKSDKFCPKCGAKIA